MIAYSTYMWNVKYGTNESFYKPETELTCGCQGGKGGEGLPKSLNLYLIITSSPLKGCPSPRSTVTVTLTSMPFCHKQGLLIQAFFSKHLHCNRVTVGTGVSRSEYKS